MEAPSELYDELVHARAEGLTAACRRAERRHGLPPGLLLAVASRESRCQNVVGDAGHGRGAFRIDDRLHGAWLAANSAAAEGGVPPVDAAADFAAALLAAELVAGRSQGLRDDALIRFAAAAYNGGRSPALRGLAQGDPDLETAGRDYGRDVVGRLRLFRLLLAAPPAGERTTLEPGALGPAVAELKRLLHLWFSAHPPVPEFAGGPGYGPATVEAVRVFQRANGLEPDGIVGPRTWDALTGPQPHARQLPPLPAHVSFPLDEYPQPDTWFGLQPWIVPQAHAIAEHFGIDAVAGWGTHPPHAPRSDHRWGGALDLAGPRGRMIECTLWADGLCADPHRAGMVFRWVGGPARDPNGVEPGHANHVHLSWYRYGPATSVFGTPGFD